MRATTLIILLFFIAIPYTLFAGPYDVEGIDKDDASLVAWASGYQDYLPAGEVGEAWSDPEKALGPATGSNFDIVSLGDPPEGSLEPPGKITLTFDVTIINDIGYDIVVFENGFPLEDTLFSELAYLEVSTDGETFSRFPCVSLTKAPLGGYEVLDPTDIFNLAGIHRNAYGVSTGTPFDLDDLVDDQNVLSQAVDLDNINYVRIVDVPGTGEYFDTATYFGYDQDNIIYDPYPAFDSGGFDLEAVGIINAFGVDPGDDDDETLLDDDDDDIGDDDEDSESGKSGDDSGSSCG